MIARILPLLLALAISPAFSQTGLYGPVPTHLKAGDPAPGIAFTTLLSAPTSDSWSQANLSGRLTVLAFYPNTSHNLQAVTQWNRLVTKFAHKSVQFVWITAEKDSTLQPSLSQHAIMGWVLRDPTGQTGNAFGLELPEIVLIGPDRKIIGFDESLLHGDELLNAALEHRITNIRPTSKTIDQFIASKQIYLAPEPHRIPLTGDHRPNFPPSYTLHVTPSHSEDRTSSGSESYHSLQRFTLKEAIDDAYSINPIRVHLPATLDLRQRYDFALVLPEQEDENQMKVRFQQGIQSYFHLNAHHEYRQLDVYVLSALPDRQPPQVKPHPDEAMSGFSSASMQFQTSDDSKDSETGPGETTGWPKPFSIDTLRGISMDGTADQLCHQLESQLDRPVVNETNLRGEFQFHVQSSEGEKNDLRQHLRDQLGLILTPTQRSIDVLVFDPQ